jgi:DNA-binding Lrp family transcriptional regulator
MTKLANQEQFDGIDQKMLAWFGENDFSSVSEMSKDLGISTGQLRHHLRDLRKSGVVRMAMVAEPEKLGFNLIVLIRFVMAHGTADETIRKLAKHRPIKWLASITGRNDLLAYCWFRSTRDLTDFLQNQTKDLKGIKETEVFFCMQVLKGLYTQS